MAEPAPEIKCLYLLLHVSQLYHHALNNRHFGRWIFPLPTLSCVSPLAPCLDLTGWSWVYLVWHDGRHTPLLWSPRFTHEHHTALILSPPLKVSRLAKERGCPDFSSTIGSGGSPSIIPWDFQLHWTRYRKSQMARPPKKRIHLFAQMQSDTSVVRSKY